MTLEESKEVIPMMEAMILLFFEKWQVLPS